MWKVNSRWNFSLISSVMHSTKSHIEMLEAEERILEFPTKHLSEKIHIESVNIRQIVKFKETFLLITFSLRNKLKKIRMHFLCWGSFACLIDWNWSFITHLMVWIGSNTLQFRHSLCNDNKRFTRATRTLPDIINLILWARRFKQNEKPRNVKFLYFPFHQQNTESEWSEQPHKRRCDI